MKKSLLILSACLILTLSLTGCGNNNSNKNNSSSNSKSTTKFYSSEEANAKLTEQAILTGNQDSKITIIEASDFECPACRYWHQEFKKVVDEYNDRVKFGYIAFPLSYHPDALPTAIAAQAAQNQGKGWEAHEYFFEGDELDTAKIDNIVSDLKLDADRYTKDLDSSEITNKINQGMELLNELNLSGTPTFFINGVMYNGNPDYESLKAKIDKLL